MLKKYYLGRSFWVPIPHKRYQNTRLGSPVSNSVNPSFFWTHYIQKKIFKLRFYLDQWDDHGDEAYSLKCYKGIPRAPTNI